MMHSRIRFSLSARPGLPVVRRISRADLPLVLRRGLADFSEIPSHAVFLCVIYPLVCILLFAVTFGYPMLRVVFPVGAGLALVGPPVATALLELSRRREAGLSSFWARNFNVLHWPSYGAVVVVNFMLMALFLIWLEVADAIYVANFGYPHLASIDQLTNEVFKTWAGWNLIVVGTGIGVVFALLVLTIWTVALPLLLDRDVSAAVVLLTSIRVIATNPLTMAVWGSIVAALLVIGSMPLFLGLTVVIPVLGHATWHLYRAAIEPGPHSHQEYRPQLPVRHYAHDFPSAPFAPVGDSGLSVSQRGASGATHSTRSGTVLPNASVRGKGQITTWLRPYKIKRGRSHYDL
jgi:uncharacterized membrane protein